MSKKIKFWFFTNLRMRGLAMLIQWEEEEKSGYENSKKIKVFLRKKKAWHYRTDPWSDKTWWMTFQKDKKQKKIHRNMPQYGIKGGKMGQKQQKRPSRNYLRISQAIYVMKLNCFLTELRFKFICTVNFFRIKNISDFTRWLWSWNIN